VLGRKKFVDEKEYKAFAQNKDTIDRPGKQQGSEQNGQDMDIVFDGGKNTHGRGTLQDHDSKE